jgi:hypothetical protein
VGRPYTSTITSAAWIDMDNDGVLDLVLSDRTTSTSSSFVLRQYHGRFVQMRDLPFAADARAVGAISPCDFDHDGQVDVFTGFGPTEEAAHLYLHRGNDYYDVAGKSGLSPKNGMTSAIWFDYNNDLWPDLFVVGASSTQVQLYQNVHVRSYHLPRPVATSNELIRGATQGLWADAVDANMDGWTDLFIIKGNRAGCSLMMNDGGNGWRDMANDLGVAFPNSDVRSAAWADCEGDGDLDLVVALGSGGVRLYENSLIQVHDYIRVNLLGTGVINTAMNYCRAEMIFQNCKQIGATVPVTCNGGGDEATLLFVNRSEMNRTTGELVVNWPNGIQRRYRVTSLHWNGTTNLHMPATQEQPPLAETPETPLAGEITISPNPFNPTTNLAFTLTNTADVSLVIYDLLGRQVADLAHGPLSAGEHRLTFDASELPSGMYFSRLTVNGTPNVKRLMLAK